MNYVSDWIDTLCMEWQKQPNDFMIIDGLEDANPSIIAKGALLMDKQKNGELSRMFGYAGKFHVLTVLDVFSPGSVPFYLCCLLFAFGSSSAI